MLIYHNVLNGDMALGGVICNSALPFNVDYIGLIGTPISYTWSTGAITTIPTTTISLSGNYWVTIHDVHQCQASIFPAENVSVVNIPTAIISGRQNYCQGETVHLVGYLGSGIGYQWFRNGSPDSTGYEVDDAGLAPGDYY
jgi:hypothetical protein